jgi:hypothetical protein
MRRFGLLAALLPLTTACGSSPEIDPVALVAPHPKYKYEIEIRATVNDYGGPCNPPRLIPTRVGDHHWLYVNRLEGPVGGDEMLLTYKRDDFEFPQSALKGTVTFTENAMTVQLQRPYYKGNTVDHYTPYPYNGRYELRPRQGN